MEATSIKVSLSDCYDEGGVGVVIGIFIRQSPRFNYEHRRGRRWRWRIGANKAETVKRIEERLEGRLFVRNNFINIRRSL